MSCWHLTLSSAYIPVVCVRVFKCAWFCVIFFCTFLWSLLAPFLLFLSSPLANTTHGGRTDDTFAGLHLAYEVKKLMYAFYFLLTTTSISSFVLLSFHASAISLSFFLIQLDKIVLLCNSKIIRFLFSYFDYFLWSFIWHCYSKSNVNFWDSLKNAWISKCLLQLIVDFTQHEVT